MKKKEIQINPETSALMVIDMQNAFCDVKSPLCVKGAKSTIPSIVKNVKEAREKGIQIIWVKRIYKEDGSDMEAFRKEKLQTLNALDLMSEGSVGARLAQGLEEKAEDAIFIKKRYSAFFKTSLDDFLRDRQIDTILLAGTQLPNCVRATAVDGLSLDYRVVLLESCISSADKEVQNANLYDLENLGTINIKEINDLIL